MFNKLKQVGTVNDYEDKFEELRALISSRNRNFTEEYYVSSFVSGLRDHIKGAVKMFRPQTLADTIFLAKQEEAKSKTNNNFPKLFTKPTSTSSYETKVSTMSPWTENSKPQTKDFSKTRSTLSSKEILERREKGLCFHCDKAYHPGKECKAKIYAILGESDENLTEESMEDVIKEMEHMLKPEESPGEISLLAMAGTKSLSTVRLQGL